MENTLAERIALFGGTFDPIHIGHMNLAIQMLEACHLDTVFFSPAFCSPYKIKNPPSASILDRMKMVELCIQDHPNFKLLTFEAKTASVSYTIDTLKHLRDKYPSSSLFLILSEDSAKNFLNWKQADEILNMATILTGGSKEFFLKIDPSLRDVLKKGFVHIPMFELNSTQIRDRIKKRLYCSHLLYHKVLTHIKDQKLYRP